MFVIVLTQNIDGVTIDETNSDERQTFRFVESLFLKEVSRPRRASISPRNHLLLAKVLHHVEVNRLPLIDFSDINNWCSCEIVPELRDDSLCDVVAPDNQMVVRPAFGCHFQDSEVLELANQTANFRCEGSHAAFGALISRSWVIPELSCYSECDQPVWPCIFTSLRVVSYLALTAVPTAPPFASYLNHDPQLKLLAKSTQALRTWARVNQDLIFRDGREQE